MIIEQDFKKMIIYFLTIDIKNNNNNNNNYC